MSKYDVIIIGAGAAGSAVAWRLSNLDLRVVCLEQGDYKSSDEFPSENIAWEEKKYSTHHVSPNVRRLESDYPINDSESVIAVANYNAVGGSTFLYSGHFPRFHPSDFRVHSLDNVALDWPLSYSELEPYFELNDQIMGISGLEGDPAYPPIKNLLPPVPLGKLGERIAEGFNQLGWHWWPAYSAILTQIDDHNFKDRTTCRNIGPCNTGCPIGAKSSVDVAYWPKAIANGVELKTKCRVSRIFLKKDGFAGGVCFFDESNQSQQMEASIVVLACNGIGTPRILLNSSCEQYPNGLANSSDLVGRHLMFHPYGWVEGVFEEDLESHLGPQGCCLLSQEFYETDLKRGFVRGYTMQLLRGAGPLETAISGVNRRLISWGPDFHRSFRRRFGKVANLAIIVEDLPDFENRVTLDDHLCDQHGIPAPKVRYQLGDNSRKMMAHGLRHGKILMKTCGALSTSAFGPVRHTGWHLMGTARMGNDPKDSVVNRFGQSHDIPNLFIADSSVFVTSGGVNPMSTLQAVSLWIADGIRQELGDLL